MATYIVWITFPTRWKGFQPGGKVSTQVETFQARWKGFHPGGKGSHPGVKVSTRVLDTYWWTNI